MENDYLNAAVTPRIFLKFSDIKYERKRHTFVHDREKCTPLRSYISRAVNITLIRIGHLKLTHKYRLKGEQQPECIFCGCPSTLHHIFLECSDI